jgi:3alpha(or 20beta)-hydroxysteroid dehydrogenase
MFRLDGKVALVTGGARGIGAAIARAMVAEGANVVIGDLLDREGEALAEEIGASAKYVHLEVTKPDDWETAVATAVKTYGKLNVLVNNAGISGYAPIEEYSRADWDKIIAINLTGVFNGIKAAVPALKQAGGGSIVNMSSLAGMRGEAGMSGYVATKWAVRGLTKAAALDLARYGIRANSVHPGVVRTPLMAEGPQPGTSHVAMGRYGEPNEIANLTVFLASDESSFSTGAEFIADGGEGAGMIRQFIATAKEPVREPVNAGR